MRKFYFSGLIYDWSIEPLLKRIKQRATRFIFQYDLFPALDLCCGTGIQCHMAGIKEQSVFGLDLDFKMIDYAHAKYPHIPFICADATEIPVRNASIKGIIISYALHDKPPELRALMMEEVKRLLAPDGKIILIDFEPPWNRRSRVGGFFTYLIERIAGRAHFRNGRQFLRQGGLRTFISRNGLVEIERRDIELGNSSIVVAEIG